MGKETKEFGKKLIEIRENAGLIQSEVAERGDISQRTIGRLERGEISNASMDSLMTLSKIYDEDIVSLYISYVYESYSILEDIIERLDINAMFLTEKELDSMIRRLDLISIKRDSKSFEYKIELTRLFVETLQTRDRDTLIKKFENIYRGKINNDNILTNNYNILETRILLNIASHVQDYKGISNIALMKKCKNSTIDDSISVNVYNNFANIHYKNKEYDLALSVINEGISNCFRIDCITGLIYLQYTKFLILYELNTYDYYKELDFLKLLISKSNNGYLNKYIYNKVKRVLEPE